MMIINRTKVEIIRLFIIGAVSLVQIEVSEHLIKYLEASGQQKNLQSHKLVDSR